MSRNAYSKRVGTPTWLLYTWDDVMRCTQLRVLLASTLALIGGCTLVASSDDERRPVGPGPNAPVIRIEPATPRTDDDLVAYIDVPSEDPQGEDVSYTYEWLRDGNVVSTDAMLGRTHTSKGQSWTLRVTAHAGSRAGAPAETVVAIANTPPRIRSAGISRYDLFPDETVSVFGDAEDADGDPVVRRVQWRLGDQVLTETSSSLALGSLGPIPGGTELRLELTPFDGETTGESETVGPAIIRSAATQWRPLAPPPNGGCVIPDAVRRRILYVAQTTSARDKFGTLLWEYSLDLGTWQRLVPAGTPPRVPPEHCVVDADGQRAFLFLPFNMESHVAVPAWDPPLVLRFDVRGGERWEPLALPMDGEVGPSRRLHAISAYDAGRDRILFFGGYDPATQEVLGDLWSLDVSASATGYHLVAASTPLGRLLASSLGIDAARSRAYFFGGTRAGDAQGTLLTPSADIWELDLASDVFGATPVAQLPATTSYAGVIPDATSGSFYVGQGYAAITDAPDDWFRVQTGPARSQIYRFDAVRYETTLVSDDDGTRGAAAGMVGFLDDGALFIASPSYPNFAFSYLTSSTELWRVPLDGSAGTPILVRNVTYPAVVDAAMTTDSAGHLHVIFGREMNRYVTSSGIYKFDPSGRWERLPATNVMPTPRWSPGEFTSSDASSHFLAGGVATDEAEVQVPLHDIWRYRANDRAWSRLHDGSGRPAGFPASLRYANIWFGCGGLNVYGGATGANDPVFTLNCSSTPCTTWSTGANLVGTYGRSTGVNVHAANGSFILRGTTNSNVRSFDAVPPYNACVANTYTPTGISFNMSGAMERARAHRTNEGVMFYAVGDGSIQVARSTGVGWTIETVTTPANLPDPHPAGTASAVWNGDLTAYNAADQRLFLYREFGAVWELHYAP